MQVKYKDHRKRAVEEVTRQWSDLNRSSL